MPDRPLAQSLHDLKSLFRRRDLCGATAASAYLWFLAAMSQVNVYLSATTSLDIRQSGVGPLLGVLAFGAALGSILATVWSGDDIELGLTPIGAGGIVVCCVLMYLVPHVASAGSSLAYDLSCGALVLMGVCAGLYDIPMRAYLQDSSRRTTRGETLSAANFLIFAAMLLAAGLFYALTEWLHIGAPMIFLIGAMMTAAAMLPMLYYLRKHALAALAKPFRSVSGSHR